MATGTKIFKVDTEDGVGGKNFIAFAKGAEEDIRKYYEPKRATVLYLEELIVKEVTSELANTSADLITEKTTLEVRIKEINELLNV